MPKLEYNGLQEFGAVLQKLDTKTEGVLKMAVYDGAHVVFEEVKRQIQALPTNDTTGKHRDITPAQKAGLLSGLYGSQIQADDGNVYEYIGFTGYNSVRTKKHPKGQPNILIARSVESGATYMNKRPFINKAKNASKSKALEATKRTFEREIKKITE